MQTLVALLVAAAAACAIARPPAGPTAAAPASLQAPAEPLMVRAPPPPPREYLGDYLLPRFLLPHYLGYEESPRSPPSPVPDNDWLNKEIYRINQMEEEVDLVNPYEVDVTRWIAQDTFMRPVFEAPGNIVQDGIDYASEPLRTNFEDIRPLGAIAPVPPLTELPQQQTKRDPAESHVNTNEHKMFALTPLDKGYYDPIVKPKNRLPMQSSHGHHEGGDPRGVVVLQPPRQTRQNPNLSKQKNLLGPELGRLKTGFSHDGDGGSDATEHPRHIHVLETTTSDPADSIYGVALIAAIGAALTMAIFGFAFGWYTLSRKAKAAADVDYPAYGVTGPTIDTSGDRKLAHSAHMYHYQHQKQQIIAMERNGLEQRTGSVSDPESEEENEEGDYTVYECPGFATTGDMEVKNPLFSEEPTPATPGKCEVVKPQPKD